MNAVSAMLRALAVISLLLFGLFKHRGTARLHADKLMLNKFLFSFSLMLAGTAASVAGLPGHPAEDSHPPTSRSASTPERSAQVEALIRSKLLDDPHSPRIGSHHPALTLVCFTDYSCKDCKALDEKLHRLLQMHPRLALTYKFSPSRFQPLNPSRMALTLWEEQPDRFEAFHLHLMRYQGLLDDYAIRSAIRAAGGTVYQMSPSVTHTLALNKALMKKLSIPNMPATLIGDKVLAGNVSLKELDDAVTRALTES